MLWSGNLNWRANYSVEGRMAATRLSDEEEEKRSQQQRWLKEPTQLLVVVTKGGAPAPSLQKPLLT